jgi:hypothetical protein
MDWSADVTMNHEKLKKPRRYGPEVRLIHGSEGAVVEKTDRDRSLPVKMMGYALVFWEGFIYRKLRGIDGIPQLMPCPDRLTLVTRFMGGKNLRDAEILPGEEYFHALTGLIRKMHERGSSTLTSGTGGITASTKRAGPTWSISPPVSTGPGAQGSRRPLRPSTGWGS